MSFRDLPPFWQRQAQQAVMIPGTCCRLCRQQRYLWIDSHGYVWEICRTCDTGAL